MNVNISSDSTTTTSNNIENDKQQPLQPFIPRCRYKMIEPLFAIAFDGTNEECGICKLSLNESSIAYQTDNNGQTSNNLGLMYFTGKCGHSFHADCITQWVFGKNNQLTNSENSQKKKCPFCISEWEVISKTNIKSLSN